MGADYSGIAGNDALALPAKLLQSWITLAWSAAAGVIES